MAIWTADDGTTINFEVYGEGLRKETLLLLPGILGSVSSQWREFIRPLMADFRLVLMDPRGHGRSDNQATDLHPERMVQDIEGLLDFLQAQPVHIAGYSLGGYLGLLLALHQPERVATLLVHGTKFYWTKEAVQKIRDQLDPESLAVNVPSYADQLVQQHGARQWRNLARQTADLVSMLAEHGLTEQMAAQIRCPVIVSVGDRDELVPVVEAQRLSRILPQGQLLVLPGVQHSFQTLRLVPLLPMMQHFHSNEYQVR